MRTEVMVNTKYGAGPYWVDSFGYVWDSRGGGKRWDKQAVRLGESVWHYTPMVGDTLVLTEVLEPLIKPPLGLRPDYVAVAEYDRKRCTEIGEAILRYASALYPVPQEWIDEMNELIERNQPEDPEV